LCGGGVLPASSRLWAGEPGGVGDLGPGGAGSAGGGDGVGEEALGVDADLGGVGDEVELGGGDGPGRGVLADEAACLVAVGAEHDGAVGDGGELLAVGA